MVTRKCDVGDLGQKMNWSKSGRVFTLNSERIARFLSLLCSKQIQFAQSEIILSAKIDKWDVQKGGNRNTRKILTVENCQTFTWRSEMCLQFQVCFERSGFNLRITSLQAQKVRLLKVYRGKLLTGWKPNRNNYGRNQPQLHLEELDFCLRVTNSRVEVLTQQYRRADCTWGGGSERACLVTAEHTFHIET